MRVFSKKESLIISCYGDSNTRYYFGDDQIPGPAEDSYPEKLQRMFSGAAYTKVIVLNNGFPDMQTDFALAHFEENTRDAGICIMGFGTNDIRQPDADLSNYLRSVHAFFKRCRAANIEPMALLIPWFSEDYAGLEAQERLPLWNRALAGLCAEESVQIIDTYSIFQADPVLFFNECRTARRHYSKEATEVIAQMVFDMTAPCIR